MKKKILGGVVAVALISVSVFNLNYSFGTSANAFSNVSLGSIDALGACESIGWKGNDGNCVNNGSGGYFCKTDSWYAITDCKL